MPHVGHFPPPREQSPGPRAIRAPEKPFKGGSGLSFHLVEGFLDVSITKKDLAVVIRFLMWGGKNSSSALRGLPAGPRIKFTGNRFTEKKPQSFMTCAGRPSKEIEASGNDRGGQFLRFSERHKPGRNRQDKENGTGGAAVRRRFQQTLGESGGVR